MQDLPDPKLVPSRRSFLGSAALGSLGVILVGCGSTPAEAKGPFKVQKSAAQWRAALSKQEFHVLREAGTERAYTSPLNDEKRKGIFACAGCGNRVYSSAHKYDSGTGWPSFWQAVDEANVETKPDRGLFYTRTEVHCRRCGSHLGHIFEDGPEPTGLRHCINGVSLTFQPQAA
jgi:peptide-methionine (R)-S-oxide reductase